MIESDLTLSQRGSLSTSSHRIYQELAFHLEDSASFRAFARLPWGWNP
ncbi:hypothetical protein GOL41_33500, partial [Sinorhizobium medicae]|nr:hypothetical protein [Sinorhizobium medicae]